MLRRAIVLGTVFAITSGVPIPFGELSALADGCTGGFVRGSIAGEGNRVRLSLDGRSASCGAPSVQPISGAPQPYFTHEIACSSNRQAAAAGLCSATPCAAAGQFFAFRTLHHPNGTTTPAGFQCVTLTQATPTPGLTTAQVFAAIRRVTLPGGHIGAIPQHRGLANLDAFFYLHGATHPPIDLHVGGQIIHAEFHPVEYRWTFGDGHQRSTTGPGTPSRHSEVHSVFHRRGRYQVTVTVLWTAQAFVAGRRVGQVEELASRAATSYPVAELRTTLTG
jgi:PKD domain